MKLRNLVSILTALVLMLTMSVGVFAEGETLKIGGISPLTGEVAQYGLAVKEGIDLYVDLINEKGGVNGQQIEVLWEDDKGDPTEAINAFNKLVNKDGVSAIFGAVTSKPTLAIAELATEVGIPMITASATAYDVTTGNPSVFRSCFLDPFQASTMANYAKDTMNAQKVAVLYDIADDYSMGLAEAFRAQAEANGQEVVAYEAATATDVDFKSQLTNIAAQEPEAIFVALYYGPTALVVKQMREVGLSVPVLGADGLDGLESQVDDFSLIENVYFTGHFAFDATTDSVVAFKEAFNKKYGKDPYNAFNATAYDAAMILLTAIQNAGSSEYEAVVAQMKSTNVEGVTGQITFDDHNDPIKSAFIMSFRDGQKTFIELKNP